MPLLTLPSTLKPLRLCQKTLCLLALHLTLDFYSHKNTQSIKIIAAIRGFSYHGFRTKLTALGYEFFDLPNSISAIQLFLIKRSGHLISYRAPVQYLIEKNKLSMKDDLPVLPLANINIYYAISGQSPHIKKLKAVLDDYVSKHKLTFFDPLN
jgi:hypothetical protein